MFRSFLLLPVRSVLKRFVKLKNKIVCGSVIDSESTGF